MGLRDPKLCFWRWRDGQSRNHFVSLGQAPKHQFALWYRDDFNDSVGAGLGVVRKSRQFAATRTSATATRLLALTCIYAALFFTANERLELQANVNSLDDERRPTPTRSELLAATPIRTKSYQVTFAAFTTGFTAWRQRATSIRINVNESAIADTAFIN
nr:hypothetical protein [uncultured Sphingorhabdus sp.]